MKTACYFLFLFFFYCSFHAQDACPSFKLGRKSIQLKFVPKFKKKEVHVKVTPTIILGFTGGITSKNASTTMTSKDTIVTSSNSFSFTDKNMDKNYAGVAILFNVEKLFKKKTTLEYVFGIEFLSRVAFPDTNRFKYAGVNMNQFYTGESGRTREGIDYVNSQNLRLGLNYRYYLFKKVYRGLYIGPSVQLAFGRNQYQDMDKNDAKVNLTYKEWNAVVGMGAVSGYQLIIKKHFVIDFSLGLIFKQGFGFSRKYADSNVNKGDIVKKYPNSVSRHHIYNPGYSFGIGFGYKFL